MKKENYGILLIILGNLLFLSYIFFGNKISSSFSEFSSGVLLGLSIGTNLVGIIITSVNKRYYEVYCFIKRN